MRESCVFLKVSPSSESSLHDATAMSVTLSSYHFKHRHAKINLSPEKQKNLGYFMHPESEFICRLEMHFRRHKLSVWKIYNETQRVTEKITEIQKVFHVTTQFQLVNRLVCVTYIL